MNTRRRKGDNQPQHRSRREECFGSRRGARSGGWQENFREYEKARGEESREQNSEWAPVVPNMEAGGSHLQTTDPRNMVENIAMDDLEEKIGRGSVGLGRERESVRVSFE